jgi:hypothetical protein
MQQSITEIYYTGEQTATLPAEFFEPPPANGPDKKGRGDP